MPGGRPIFFFDTIRESIFRCHTYVRFRNDIQQWCMWTSDIVVYPRVVENCRKHSNALLGENKNKFVRGCMYNICRREKKTREHENN